VVSLQDSFPAFWSGIEVIFILFSLTFSLLCGTELLAYIDGKSIDGINMAFLR